MRKIVLAYNFTPERLQALCLIGMMLKVKIREVSRKELLQPVGYLAGVSGLNPVQEEYTGDEGRQELIFLAGFDRLTLDRLLEAVQKSRLGRIELKAMLTQTNQTWTGLKLLQNIAEEHAYMQKNGKMEHPQKQE
mgnify:CR=1 FL=1